MDEADLLSQSLEQSNGVACAHTHTSKQSWGKVTEATTTECRQDRGKAETPTWPGCQLADHTEDVAKRA